MAIRGSYNESRPRVDFVVASQLFASRLETGEMPRLRVCTCNTPPDDVNKRSSFYEANICTQHTFMVKCWPHTHTHADHVAQHTRLAAAAARRLASLRNCEIRNHNTGCKPEDCVPPPTPEKVNALRAFGLDWPASRDDLAIGEHEMALVRVPKVG